MALLCVKHPCIISSSSKFTSKYTFFGFILRVSSLHLLIYITFTFTLLMIYVNLKINFLV